jgi:uncharacterized protein (TIGR00725 family)
MPRRRLAEQKDRSDVAMSAPADTDKHSETHPFSGPIREDVDKSYDTTNDPTVRTIGVMGSAGGAISEAVRRRVFDLGVAVAKSGCVLITGACPGLPYDAARGARSVGGLSIGISPALSRSEHVLRYESPVDAYDVIIYTGSGLMGREVDNIHSSDIVIIAGGRSGTLGEFSIAYDEGKLIGILANSDGIADDLKTIVPMIHKKTGARLVYEADPIVLVTTCIEIYRTEHYKHPSVFVENPDEVEQGWAGSPSSAQPAS